MSKLKAAVLSLSVDPVSSAVSSVVDLLLSLLLLIVLVLMVLQLIVTKGSIALLSSAVSSAVGLLLIAALAGGPPCYSVIITLTGHNFLTTHTTNGHKPAQMAKKHGLQKCNSFETSVHGELCKFEESLMFHALLSMFANINLLFLSRIMSSSRRLRPGRN